MEDGGQVFPRAGNESFTPREGMSLRDWFAGMAMQGMLANTDLTHHDSDAIATLAYGLADAMLAERGSS